MHVVTCPGCKRERDGQTAVRGDDHEIKEDGTSICVCADCGCLYVVEAGFITRAMTTAEVDALPKEIRQDLGRAIVCIAIVGTDRRSNN